MVETGLLGCSSREHCISDRHFIVLIFVAWVRYILGFIKHAGGAINYNRSLCVRTVPIQCAHHGAPL